LLQTITSAQISLANASLALILHLRKCASIAHLAYLVLRAKPRLTPTGTYRMRHKRLLPASAAPSVPRSDVIVVLNEPIDPWLSSKIKTLSQTERRIGKKGTTRRIQMRGGTLVKSRICCRQLQELLSGADAVWNLCAIDSACAQGRPGINVQGYIVSVDASSRSSEITFKLTQETISKLFQHYEHGCIIGAEIFTGEEQQNQYAFEQRAAKLVLHVDLSTLRMMTANGSGALRSADSERVTVAVLKHVLGWHFDPTPANIDHRISVSCNAGMLWHGVVGCSASSPSITTWPSEIYMRYF
jgi:hypothetical protein